VETGEIASLLTACCQQFPAGIADFGDVMMTLGMTGIRFVLWCPEPDSHISPI
jgi:hypothetical protein